MSESNDAKAASPDTPPKPKGAKLPLILALVNLVAVLGLGGYLFYTQQLAAAQAKKTAAAGKQEHGAKAEEHGAKAEEHGAADDEAGAAEEDHGGGEEAAEGHGKAAGGHGGGAEEEVEASPHGDERSGDGPLLALDPLVTNLSDPDSDRYLKIGMQLRITSEKARPEVEAYLVPVRNQILIYLSSLTIADTTGAENKRTIQKRVKRIANESMPTSRITQVYFTEFVIQ